MDGMLLKKYIEANTGRNRIRIWEAHPHFLHKKALQNAKIGSTSLLFCRVGCASLFCFCEKLGLNFLSSKAGDFPYFFRDSSTATATETVMPTMGLLPAPRKPIISTWAGTEEEPAN